MCEQTNTPATRKSPKPSVDPGIAWLYLVQAIYFTNGRPVGVYRKSWPKTVLGDSSCYATY